METSNPKTETLSPLELTFDAYATAAAQSAVYPEVGQNLPYVLLGLCGEVGEICQKITTSSIADVLDWHVLELLFLVVAAGEIAEAYKKAIRDDGGALTDERGERVDSAASRAMSIAADLSAPRTLISRPIGIPPELTEQLIPELGDVSWYLSQLARESGSSLSEVAWENLRKLRSRERRNQLHGSGDHR